MALFTVKNDKVVSLSDIFPYGFFRIELESELVEIGDLKMGAVADLPRCPGQFLLIGFSATLFFPRRWGR